MIKYSFLILVALVFSSCLKDWFSTENVVVEKSLNGFDSLVVSGIFEIYLTQDTVNTIRIEGEKDIVSSVNALQNGQTLELTRKKYTNLQPKNNTVKIYLHTLGLSSIKMNNSSKIVSTNTMKINSLGVVLLSEIGEINLDIDGKSFSFWNNHPSFGKMVLSGKLESLVLWNYSAYAVDAQNLYSQTVFVENHSIADCYVNPLKKLECGTYQTGNIYYSGSPESVIIQTNSNSGHVFKK